VRSTCHYGTRCFFFFLRDFYLGARPPSDQGSVQSTHHDPPPSTHHPVLLPGCWEVCQLSPRSPTPSSGPWLQQKTQRHTLVWALGPLAVGGLFTGPEFGNTFNRIPLFYYSSLRPAWRCGRGTNKHRVIRWREQKMAENRKSMSINITCFSVSTLLLGG